MKKLKKWIQQHQIAAFYMIAFVITWGLAFSYDAIVNRDQYLLMPVLTIAICGPAFAGIIISSVINTGPRRTSRKSFWIAFLAAWCLSVLVFLANQKFIEGLTLTPVMVGVILVAVIPVAFVIASAYSRNPSVRNYLSSLVRLRGMWGWSLLAFLLIPALTVVAIPVGRFLGAQSLSYFKFPEISLNLIGLVVVKFFYQLFFFNATAEETGWRGFVMPRLQARTSPLWTALIIGLIWAPWHFLFWKADGRPVMTAEFWVEMLAAHMLLSVVIVWLCNRARGSILVAGIAHAATNTIQPFVPMGDIFFLILFITTLVLVVIDRMWEQLPSDHPAVFRQQGLAGFSESKSMPVQEVSNV
jgi:membrane protease YdiL (CAAX protease family)